MADMRCRDRYPYIVEITIIFIMAITIAVVILTL